MVSPSAKLPVRTFLHALEGLRLSAKQGETSTGSSLGLPCRGEGRVVAEFVNNKLGTVDLVTQHKGFLHGDHVMLQVQNRFNQAPTAWVDTAD
eukprot:2645500-Amphidinium_carterae.1